MHTLFYKRLAAIILSAACVFNSIAVIAQDKKRKTQKREEIIIKKKTDKDEKTTIVIDGDKVTVNGKPITDLNDKDVIVKKLNLEINDDLWNNDNDEMDIEAPVAIDIEAPEAIAPLPPMPPMPPIPDVDFQPGDFNINEDFNINGDNIYFNNQSKPMLGVYTEKDDKGAKITNVVEGSPAEKAGLQKGDIITKVGDKSVSDPASLADIIGDMEPNKEVDIYYLRDKKEKKVTVKLGERKESFSKSFNFAEPSPKWNQDFFKYKFNNDGLYNKRPRLGIRIQDLEEGDGVKVIDLEDSSAAAKSGIKKDDVITNIDGTDIKNTDDAREKMNAVREKSTYPVKVLRNGSPVTVEVKIPKKLKTTDL
ncbi:MAG: PDZ domain-containing protein [Agriterribacter sp.]